MSVPGLAVQILNLVDDSTHPTQEGRLLKLNTQVLRDITGKVDNEGHALAVIAIAGPERQGKSFILTYFVRYLQALERSGNGSTGDWMERDHPHIPTKDVGFPFQNSFERTTEGIWMWSRPFIIPSPDNPMKKIAVLLMDTEGCYGSSLSNQEQAAFVGLSLLTSSVFIYNETSRVNENTLATVGKFMEYGQLASQTSQAKMFQRMMFLVRDWNNPTLFEYGAAGGQGFIRKLFEQTPNMSKDAVKYRKAIMKNFEDCNAYLMPHPGEQVISDQFKGSVGEMKPEFQQHVQCFVENLMADIAPKKVSGQGISGSEYACLFIAYVNAFNSSEMPSPASIIKTALFIAFDTEIRRLTETFEKDLRARMDEVEDFVPSDQLMKMKKQVEANIVRLFEEKKHACSPDDKALYSQKLKSELDRAYVRTNEENERNRGRFLEEAGNSIIERFRDYLTTSVHSSDRYWKQVDFENTVIPEQKRFIQYFCEICSSVPAQYVQVQADEVTEKMNSMKETLWLDLAQKRKLAEQRAEAILQEILADYVNTMALLIDDEIQTDIKIDRLFQKQSTFASNNFRRRMELEFKDPTFITECVNQLEAILTAEIQNTKAINCSKWDKVKSEFETEKTDATNAFAEKVETMFRDISTADIAALTVVYENIKEIGVEALEEVPCPCSDLRKQYIRKLKEELKKTFDEALDTLANSVEAKMLRCQQIAESSSQKFEDELRRWIRSTGTVTSTVFDSESRQMMENELAKCHDSMNSVYAKHESLLNNAKQMMEDSRMELTAANQQKAEEVTHLMMPQLHEIRRSYDSAFEDVKSQIQNTSDLQKIHRDVSTRLMEQLRQLLHQANAQSLFSTYESSVTREMNEFFDLKLKAFEATAEGVKNVRSDIIPNHEEEFREKIMGSVRRNPFFSDEDFEQILKDRCPEVMNCLFKQISLVVSLESAAGTALIDEVQFSIEQIKQQLTHELRDIREEAEKAAKSVHQRILGFAMNEISNVVESLIIQGPTAVVGDDFQDIRSTVESKFESEWPYGASSKKDEIKLGLLKKVDDEVDEARRKVLAKVNEETQIVGAAMNSTLSSYAHSIAEALISGKYIPMKKLQQQLDNGLSENQKSFESALKNRNLSHSKYTGELKEKLSEKRRSLLQTNRENLEKLLEETDGFIRRKYTCDESFHSMAELAEFKRNIEEELVQLLHDKCEGDCDDELRNQVLQKVDGQHSATVAIKEAEVNANANFHVENAVRYYSDSMTDGVGPILPQHPTILRSWHDRSKFQALQKLKRASVFVTELLEKEIEQALKQVYISWEDKNNLKGGEDKNLAIGIDLGTTTCCVAIHRLRETQVIKDRSGRNLTPSFLFIGDDGSAMVGHEAKDQAHIYPEDTVFDAKRLIGRKFNDPYVQKDMKTWPFKVEEDAVSGEPRIIIKGKPYRPEEVLAQQLRHMKIIAEEELQEPGNVKKAVITVPANFNDRQRDATRQAAQIADLDVLQIINEPTAAAMAYAVQWKGIEKTVLVFDFGGGTLDVTILRSGEDEKPSAEVADPVPSTSRGLQEAPNENELETGTESSNARLHVLTTLGNTHLGGEDFDNNLVNFCAKKFEETEGVKLLEADQPGVDLPVKRRLRRLRNECEKVKVYLTSSESATANLDTIYGDLDLQVIVTKKEFEEMNEELFQKAISVVADALVSAKLDKEDIDEVLMVGGSSRIPRMRELLQKFLGKENIHLNQRVDIQEAVAKGAAIQACIINGVSSVKGMPKVTDVQPFSLGIREFSGKISVIIPRNKTIPVKATKEYVTAVDNVTDIDITIYSGEKEVANSPENVRLGEFILNGIPPDKKGKQKIDVTMEIDASGILNVTAVCLSTGGQKNLMIKSDRGRLSDEQIVEARNKLNPSEVDKLKKFFKS